MIAKLVFPLRHVRSLKEWYSYYPGKSAVNLFVGNFACFNDGACFAIFVLHVCHVYDINDVWFWYLRFLCGISEQLISMAGYLYKKSIVNTLKFDLPWTNLDHLYCAYIFHCIYFGGNLAIRDYFVPSDWQLILHIFYQSPTHAERLLTMPCIMPLFTDSHNFRVASTGDYINPERSEWSPFSFLI